MKKQPIAEVIKLVKYQMSIYTKAKNIIKRCGFVLLLLPLSCFAQGLPTPTQDNQILIWQQGAWHLSNASLNLGSKALIDVSGKVTLLDTVSNGTGGYRISGCINPTILPVNAIAGLSVTYTNPHGVLKQNVLIYQMRVVGDSDWGGDTIYCLAGTRITIVANVSVGGKSDYEVGLHQD